MNAFKFLRRFRLKIKFLMTLMGSIRANSMGISASLTNPECPRDLNADRSKPVDATSASGELAQARHVSRT